MDLDELAQIANSPDTMGKKGVFHSRYTIISDLGRGTFGDVHLVNPKTSMSESKRLVAKKIRVTLGTERKKALQEVKILSKLHHPNIVKYVESVEDSAFLYIITEYASGGDMRAKIREGRAFTEEQIMTWFCQILLALQHIHSCKLLHRDLKPANVFLTSSGFIKLGDFGLSKSLKGGAGFANTVCGTPCYFSPELAQRQAYNQKSDVWSLGCLVYELISLRHAFSSLSMAELMTKITQGSYPPADPDNRYSPFLSEVIGLMLIVDAERRPSVTQLLQLEPVKKHLQYINEVLIPKMSRERKERSKRSNSNGDRRRSEKAFGEKASAGKASGSPLGSPPSPINSPPLRNGITSPRDDLVKRGVSNEDFEIMKGKLRDMTPQQMREVARQARRGPKQPPPEHRGQGSSTASPAITSPETTPVTPPAGPLGTLLDFDDPPPDLEEVKQTLVNAGRLELPDVENLRAFINAELPPTTGKRALVLLTRISEPSVSFEVRCEVYDEMMILLGPRSSVRFQATLMAFVFND